MKDLEINIISWIRSGRSDLVTGALLIDEARPVEGLFFCYLAIEKILNAHVIRNTRDYPPRQDDPKLLMKMANIKVNEEDMELLEVLMESRLEIRHPDHGLEQPTADQAKEYLQRSRELFSWLEMTV